MHVIQNAFPSKNHSCICLFWFVAADAAAVKSHYAMYILVEYFGEVQDLHESILMKKFLRNHYH